MLQTPHSAIDVSTIPLLQDCQTTDEQAHEPPQSQPEENQILFNISKIESVSLISRVIGSQTTSNKYRLPSAC